MCGSAVRLQPPALRGPSGKGRVIRFNLYLKLKIFHCRSNTAESLTVTQSTLTLRILEVSSDFLILGLIDETSLFNEFFQRISMSLYPSLK